MKASTPGGRFDIPFERRAILSGITQDLQHPVGQSVDWWRWNSTTTVVDDVYDVGSITGGRKWYSPFVVPCITAVIYQGVTQQNQRGFYNADVLRVTMNMEDVEKLLPTMPTSPDDFLRDRVVFRGEVFRPTHFYPRGLITDSYTLFTFDAVQINPDELVNDQQFASYAS